MILRAFYHFWTMQNHVQANICWSKYTTYIIFILKRMQQNGTDFKTTLNHRRLFRLWRFLLTISLITVFNVSFYNLQCVFLFRMCCYCLQMSLALLINKQVIQCCYIGGSRQVLLDKPLQTQKVDCLNLCQKQTQKDHFFLWQTWH